MIIILAIQFVMLWREYTKESITQASQEQVETVGGVKKAADNAHIKLDYGQQKQISETIKEIRVTEKEPMYIIQAKGSDVEKRSEQAREQEKADFSIVTDKDNPTKKVNFNELDEDAVVNLNQYNIKAYKEHINTIEYYPQEKTVGYTHQWKVSDNGHYMGVGVDYDTDDKKIMAKISYSW